MTDIRSKVQIAREILQELETRRTVLFVCFADHRAILANNTSESITDVDLLLSSQILYGKRIEPTSIVPVIRRIDWIYGTTYDAYDPNDPLLHEKNFYVVTSGISDEKNVYKVLEAPGLSLHKPTLKTARPFRTPDGYLWKYMYTISPVVWNQFATNDHIPVILDPDVAAAAIPGAIESIRLTGSGFGYTIAEDGMCTILNSTTILLPNTSSPLNNYYVNSSIYITSNFFQGQLRRISSYDGASRQAILDRPIDTYTRLLFANTANLTILLSGSRIVQNILNLIILNSTNTMFNETDTLVQSDSGNARFRILRSNSSVIVAQPFSHTANIQPDMPFRNLASAGSALGANGTISSNTNLQHGLVLDPGSGYTANVNIAIFSNTGSGATAVAVVNSTGKVASVNITAGGSNYNRRPTTQVDMPPQLFFNANTGVVGGTGEGSNNIILLSGHRFQVGDRVTYQVAPGNTAIVTLVNNGVYYIQFANSTAVALSATPNTAPGNRVQLVKGKTESGHSLQGSRAVVELFPRNHVISNITANVVANGMFVRVGNNPNVNIRYVMFANSNTALVTVPFTTNATSALHQVTQAFDANVITVNTEVLVVNGSLTGVRLGIANVSPNNATFELGERISILNAANSTLVTNGFVVAANSTIVYAINTTALPSVGQIVVGLSSGVNAVISSVRNEASAFVKFASGSNTMFLSNATLLHFSGNTLLGTTVLDRVDNEAGLVNVPYRIAPTVVIEGDGYGAEALAFVNTQASTITHVRVLNPGQNYTSANVIIIPTTSTPETGRAIISPPLGHGFNAIDELFCSKLMYRTTIESYSAEQFFFPPRIQTHAVAIVTNPILQNIQATVNNIVTYDVVLTTSTANLYTLGEYVVQNTAAGIVRQVKNSTCITVELTGGTLANNQSLIGIASAHTATVSGYSRTNYIPGEIVTFENDSRATVVNFFNGNTLVLTNLQGPLGNTVIGSNSFARSTITGSTIYGLSYDTDDASRRLVNIIRLTLASNSGAFQVNEIVEQTTSNARGRVLSSSDTVELVYLSPVGTFTIGERVAIGSANGVIIGLYPSQRMLISNILGTPTSGVAVVGVSGSAFVDAVRPVLSLQPIRGMFTTGNLTGEIVGLSSGSTGFVERVIPGNYIAYSGSIRTRILSNTGINRSTKELANTTSDTTETIRGIIHID